MTDPNGSTEIADAKRAIRRGMRSLRKALPDREERSARIWAHVRELPEVTSARQILVFASVPGEPVTAPFVAWCRDVGKAVHFPEDEPAPDPRSIDVVIVPGTAFTPSGDRLGQGGGWYDRFLATVRPDCLKVGVAFAPQLVESLPVEPHDLRVDVVVTDESVQRAPRTC